MPDTTDPTSTTTTVVNQSIPPELMPYANWGLNWGMSQFGDWTGEPFAEGSTFNWNDTPSYSDTYNPFYDTSPFYASANQFGNLTDAWGGLTSLYGQYPSEWGTASNTFSGIAGMSPYSYGAGNFYSTFNPTAFSGSYSPYSFGYGYNPTAFNGNFQATNYNMPGSNLTNYTPGQFTSGYTASPITAQQWNTDAMKQYMDPYMSGVVDIAQRDAQLDSIRQQQALNTRATQQGAFGGSRNMFENMEFQRNANQRYDDLAMKGMSQAYASALEAFGGDRDAALKAAIESENNRYRQGYLGLEAQKAAEQSRQYGGTLGLDAYKAGLDAQRYGDLSKQFGATYGLDAWQAMQEAMQHSADQQLEAQRLNDLSRQFGATYGLDAYKTNQDFAAEAARLRLDAQKAYEDSRQFGTKAYFDSLDKQLEAAGALHNLGTSKYEADLMALREQERVGALQQADAQTQKDVQYQQWLDQQQYPYKMLDWYMNLLRGVPSGQYGTTQSTYSAPPSIWSQLAGAGLGGLALYNAYSKP